MHPLSHNMKTMHRYHFLSLWLIFSITSLRAYPQQVNDYFEQIRKDPSMLTAFLTAMPKGGDLHHHFSGAMYGETFWGILTESNGWLNTNTMEVDVAGSRHKKPWKRFDVLRKEKGFDALKQAYLRKASVKDYEPGAGAGDQHFFDSFGWFSVVAGYDMVAGLREFRQRAMAENVGYIETIIGAPDTMIQLAAGPAWEQAITGASLADSTIVFSTLDQVYTALNAAGVSHAAATFCRTQRLVHQQAAVDDSTFMIRYQLHAIRNAAPLAVYRRLLLAFQRRVWIH